MSDSTNYETCQLSPLFFVVLACRTPSPAPLITPSGLACFEALPSVFLRLDKNFDTFTAPVPWPPRSGDAKMSPSWFGDLKLNSRGSYTFVWTCFRCLPARPASAYPCPCLIASVLCFCLPTEPSAFIDGAASGLPTLWCLPMTRLGFISLLCRPDGTSLCGEPRLLCREGSATSLLWTIIGLWPVVFASCFAALMVYVILILALLESN